jgi:DivIVA domain-containing protein
MDLTPRLLTEVEFKEQWRGYSPTEVDQFLAGVAAAVGDVQQRLHEAVERAMRAEQKLLERTDDDEVRRTLVLAQRTAASAIEEARAEALRIVEEARSQASAEQAEHHERMRVEMAELAERRATLQADVDVLEAYVTEHRNRLRQELTRQLDALEGSASEVPAPPLVSAVEVMPAPPEPYVPHPPTEEELAQARDDLVDALRRAGVEHVPSAADEVPSAEVASDEVSTGAKPYDAAEESGELDLRGGEATQTFDVLAETDEADDVLAWAEPEPTGEVPAVAEEVDEPVSVDPLDDDPFLAELRRAVTDDSPLGPRDESLPTSFSPDEDAVPSGRFRLRRGR